jgi:hypothetical protein
MSDSPEWNFCFRCFIIAELPLYMHLFYNAAKKRSSHLINIVQKNTTILVSKSEEPFKEPIANVKWANNT